MRVVAGLFLTGCQLVFPVEGDAPPACGALYAPIGGESSYRILEPFTDWIEAELRCEVDGAHLAVVDDRAELGRLRGALISLELTQSFWLGIGRDETAPPVDPSSFRGLTGTPAPDAWLPGEPNNIVVQEVAVRFDQGADFIDANPVESHSAICECDQQPVIPFDWQQ